jgi:hypothetical protein
MLFCRRVLIVANGAVGPGADTGAPARDDRGKPDVESIDNAGAGVEVSSVGWCASVGSIVRQRATMSHVESGDLAGAESSLGKCADKAGALLVVERMSASAGTPPVTEANDNPPRGARSTPGAEGTMVDQSLEDPIPERHIEEHLVELSIAKNTSL